MHISERSGNVARTLLVALIIAAFVMSMLPMAAFADESGRVVTIGADLTDEQRSKVLDFFGLAEGDLDDMDVIYVNNQQERQYLEGTLPDDVIGRKTMSCSYIQPTDPGSGIHIETANLNYVTRTTLYNALQTAGIEDVNLIVTAPFPVSGTGALTGVFLAYEQTGTSLDEGKKEAATEELVETSDLEHEYGEPVSEVISDVKDEVASSDHELSDEQIRDLIKAAARAKGIDLTDEDIDTILTIAKRVQELGYDGTSFADTLGEFKDRIGGQLGDADADGILGAVADWWDGVVSWFKGLVGDKQPEDIFESVNTDVFAIDGSGDATANAGDGGSGAPDADTGETGGMPANGESE